MIKRAGGLSAFIAGLSSPTASAVLVCGAILVLSGCGSAASGTVSASSPRITQAEMGTGMTDKNEVVNPTTEFAPGTPKIFCVWRAEGLRAGSAVRGVWIAEDVGPAAPADFKIAEATIHLPFANVGSLTLSKPDNDFPAGKYRLEIYIGKDLLKSARFTVVADSQ